MVDGCICARNKYPEEFDTEETKRPGLIVVYIGTHQPLFLRTTVERGCLRTTTARRRTMHQLQLPAMFLVHVLPLLLQTLSEIKIGWFVYLGS